MKTTIELPDALLHQAKVTSAQRGVTLKHLFIEGLEYVIGKQSSSKSIQLTHEESKIYQLDAEGVPVLQKRESVSDDNYLNAIEDLKEELGV
jgi:hypothetical protein